MGAKKDLKSAQAPKMPKHLVTPQFLEFQFYNTQRMDELYAKRRDWWHRYQVWFFFGGAIDVAAQEGRVMADI